jgi:hypothetical protein
VPRLWDRYPLVFYHNGDIFKRRPNVGLPYVMNIKPGHGKEHYDMHVIAPSMAMRVRQKGATSSTWVSGEDIIKKGEEQQDNYGS